jgi:hypothetical protein
MLAFVVYDKAVASKQMAVRTAWSSLTLVNDWSKWFAISCLSPFTISTGCDVVNMANHLENII